MSEVFQRPILKGHSFYKEIYHEESYVVGRSFKCVCFIGWAAGGSKGFCVKVINKTKANEMVSYHLHSVKFSRTIVDRVPAKSTYRDCSGKMSPQEVLDSLSVRGIGSSYNLCGTVRISV